MSQENIEFMRAAYETWNSGDTDAFSVPASPKRPEQDSNLRPTP
jgi:hypothetical protein